jgi:hypothetical protein
MRLAACVLAVLAAVGCAAQHYDSTTHYRTANDPVSMGCRWESGESWCCYREQDVLHCEVQR